jgi:hypothetical protein
MSVTGVFAVAAAVSVALCFLLAVLVWSETERDTMSRTEAERRARRDTDDPSTPERTDGFDSRRE